MLKCPVVLLMFHINTYVRDYVTNTLGCVMPSNQYVYDLDGSTYIFHTRLTDSHDNMILERKMGVISHITIWKSVLDIVTGT